MSLRRAPSWDPESGDVRTEEFRARTKRRKVTIRDTYIGKRGRYRQFTPPTKVKREVKNADVSLGALTTAANAASITLLNGIPQGDAENERDGRLIRPLGVEVRMQYSPVAGTDSNPIRVLMVQDKQPDGATVDITDLLVGTLTATSFSNFDQTPRFNVIKDEIWSCPAPGDAAAVPSFCHRFECPMTKCGLVTYADSGATITSIVKNSYYLILIPTRVAFASDILVQYRYKWCDV